MVRTRHSRTLGQYGSTEEDPEQILDTTKSPSKSLSKSPSKNFDDSENYNLGVVPEELSLDCVTPEGIKFKIETTSQGII